MSRSRHSRRQKTGNPALDYPEEYARSFGHVRKRMAERYGYSGLTHREYVALCKAAGRFPVLSREQQQGGEQTVRRVPDHSPHIEGDIVVVRHEPTGIVRTVLPRSAGTVRVTSL